MAVSTADPMLMKGSSALWGKNVDHEGRGITKKKIMLDQTVMNCIGNSLVVVNSMQQQLLEKTFTPTKWKQVLTCVDECLLTQAYWLVHVCVKKNEVVPVRSVTKTVGNSLAD